MVRAPASPRCCNHCWRGGRLRNRRPRCFRFPTDSEQDFRRAYIGTELLVRSELAGWEGSALEADQLLRLAYEADPQDRWIDYAVSDRLLANLGARS